MCLAIVALDAHPHYALVLVANRDEYHARPTEAAHWWTEGDILAGRDLRAGGTWLGVTRTGRWAFVTNVRQGAERNPDAPSRGLLVPRVLRDPRDTHHALIAAIADADDYNGFNMMAGEIGTASWGSNRAPTPVALSSNSAAALPPEAEQSAPWDGPATRMRTDAGTALSRGVHGLSNARLDTPWPKLLRTKAGVAAWVAAARDDTDALLQLLADRERARDDELPNTGVSREWERALSAPFITGENYGTRCSTVLTISRDGDGRFVEQSFDARGETSGHVDYAFRVAAR